MTVNKAIATCKSCHGVRTVPVEPPTTSPEEFTMWRQQHLPPCECGHDVCDLRLMVVGAPFRAMDFLGVQLARKANP